MRKIKTTFELPMFSITPASLAQPLIIITNKKRKRVNMEGDMPA
jgi:hypothetical protein